MYFEVSTRAQQGWVYVQGAQRLNGKKGIKLTRAAPEQLAALVEEKRQVSCQEASACLLMQHTPNAHCLLLLAPCGCQVLRHVAIDSLRL